MKTVRLLSERGFTKDELQIYLRLAFEVEN